MYYALFSPILDLITAVRKVTSRVTQESVWVVSVPSNGDDYNVLHVQGERQTCPNEDCQKPIKQSWAHNTWCGRV